MEEKKCSFQVAWRGACGEKVEDGEYCPAHQNVTCCSCGEQATHECNETAILVCGAPLCNDCEHTIQSNGCNSGGQHPEGLKGHCKKDEQVYKPWYMNDKKTK